MLHLLQHIVVQLVITKVVLVKIPNVLNQLQELLMQQKPKNIIVATIKP